MLFAINTYAPIWRLWCSGVPRPLAIRPSCVWNKGLSVGCTVGMMMCHEDEVRRKWIHPLGVRLRGSSCLPLGWTAHRCEGAWRGEEERERLVHYRDFSLRARAFHCSTMPSPHLSPPQQSVPGHSAPTLLCLNSERPAVDVPNTELSTSAAICCKVKNSQGWLNLCSFSSGKWSAQYVKSSIDFPLMRRGH